MKNSQQERRPSFEPRNNSTPIDLEQGQFADLHPEDLMIPGVVNEGACLILALYHDNHGFYRFGHVPPNEIRVEITSALRMAQQGWLVKVRIRSDMTPQKASEVFNQMLELTPQLAMALINRQVGLV